jgi:hypothetical protein
MLVAAKLRAQVEGQVIRQGEADEDVGNGQRKHKMIRDYAPQSTTKSNSENCQNVSAKNCDKQQAIDNGPDQKFLLYPTAACRFVESVLVHNFGYRNCFRYFCHHHYTETTFLSFFCVYLFDCFLSIFYGNFHSLKKKTFSLRLSIYCSRAITKSSSKHHTE